MKRLRQSRRCREPCWCASAPAGRWWRPACRSPVPKAALSSLASAGQLGSVSGSGFLAADLMGTTAPHPATSTCPSEMHVFRRLSRRYPMSSYGFNLAKAQGIRRMTWPGLSSWNIKLHCNDPRCGSLIDVDGFRSRLVNQQRTCWVDSGELKLDVTPAVFIA